MPWSDWAMPEYEQTPSLIPPPPEPEGPEEPLSVEAAEFGTFGVGWIAADMIVTGKVEVDHLPWYW